MVFRRNLWDPSAIDGSGTAAPDGDRVLLPDAFHFDASTPAAAANDWSGVVVDVDFVDGTFEFSDTTASAAQDASAETHAIGPAGLDWRVTPDFDDDPGWVPGVITQPSSEETSRTTGNGIAAPDASSQDDTGTETQAPGPAGLDWWVTPDFDDDPGWVPGVTVQPPHEETASSTTDSGVAPPDASQDDTAIETQAPGPAGLDWRVTPDFDDDPGWQPGVIFPPSSDERTTGQSGDAGAAATDVTPAAPDETRTLSTTLAELNEQYPGIVWPANWWLL